MRLLTEEKREASESSEKECVSVSVRTGSRPFSPPSVSEEGGEWGVGFLALCGGLIMNKLVFALAQGGIQ